MKRFLIILTFFPLLCNAQLDNSPFYDSDTIYGEKNDLYVNIKTLGFNRNDEYYSDFANGQTFFGYQFNPEMEFFISDNISLSAGLFTTQDFGNPKFTNLQPTYKIKIKLLCS